MGCDPPKGRRSIHWSIPHNLLKSNVDGDAKGSNKGEVLAIFSKNVDAHDVLLGVSRDLFMEVSL